MTMPTDRPGRTPDPITPDLIDAFFDRELDKESRDRFFAALRSDPDACADVSRTQRVISAMRKPVETPDLTAAVLGRLDRRRRFLPARLRGMVKTGRVAVAAGLLMGLLAIALVQRYAPESAALTPRPEPVSGLVRSGASDAAAGVRQLADAVESVAAQVAEPVAAMNRRMATSTPHPRPRVLRIGPLSPGETSVRTLVKADGSAIVVHRGSGPDAHVFGLPPIETYSRILWARSLVPSVDPGIFLKDNFFRLPGLDPDSLGRVELIKLPHGP